MVSVFAAFILNDNVTVKQFGLGMAVAVAVDATIVRCLLVPAVMVLLGKHAWWLPRWMDRWLPHVSVEGDTSKLLPAEPEERKAETVA
jgi:RND superfamily putative drug exporter